MENRPLPNYVIEEFEAYLKRGIPPYDFQRLKYWKDGVMGGSAL